jgi:hypothetical protein
MHFIDLSAGFDRKQDQVVESVLKLCGKLAVNFFCFRGNGTEILNDSSVLKVKFIGKSPPGVETVPVHVPSTSAATAIPVKSNISPTTSAPDLI